jgi:PKD repeat protein
MPSVTVTSTPQKGQFPLTVNFSSSFDGVQTILQYLWNFGDGRTSTEKSPEHIFYMAGTYNGTLTISDQFGNSWSTTFTIRVYDWDLTDSEEGTHVSFTDKCYRLAVRPNQGVGIVRWGVGGDLPFPEAGVGTMKGFNKANKTISLILDNRTGRFYRIGLPDVWQDKVEVYGGTDINTSIDLKEHIGITGEEAMVEHVESRIHIRPSDEANKGQSGYTAKGFLENFRVNLKMFANGDTDTPVAKLKNVSQYGEYVFSKRVEDKRLQLRIETTTSSFRTTKARQLLNNIDKITPDEIGGIKTENLYQKQFRGMDLWLSRDSKSPLLNRCSGSDVTGSYDSLVDGPDGVSNSGLSFLASDTMSETLAQKSVQSTMSFWMGDYVFDANSPVANEIFKFDTAGANDFIIRMFGTVLQLTNDGSWTQNIQLEWSGTGWVYIAITFDNNNINVYENGVLKSLIPIPAWLTTYGGAVVMVDDAVISMYDIRRIPRQVVSDALQWYYDDVINNSGDGGVLPMMR